MALSVFGDKARMPGSEEVARELGRSWAAWEALTTWLQARFEPVAEEWAFGGEKWGWTLRVKRKKRTIIYLTPCSKYFRVGFVLGEKAVKSALKCALPAGVASEIKTAQKYPEGRVVRLEIRFKKELAAVKMLAEAKMGA
jgi:hypothetical protein